MNNLVEKSVVIDNLPIGTGSALGACVRALYLTASRKMSIIGVKIKQDGSDRNFTIFSPLDDASTTLVSDLLLHLTTEPYHISEDKIANFDNVSAQTLSSIADETNELMQGLYKYTVIWNPQITKGGSSASISKTNFSNVFDAVCSYDGYRYPEDIVTLSTSAKQLNITLYLSRCRGNFTQADAAAHLDKYGIPSDVIPVAGNGQRTSKCWFTISSADNIAFEKLQLHIAGDEACIDADIQQLRTVCKAYMQLCENSLGKLS